MAKRRRRSTRRKEQLPPWMYMLFGLGVGLAIAAAIWVSDRRPAGSAAPPTAARAPASLDEDDTGAAPEPGKSYRFYDLLPQFEVIVPDEELERPAAARSAGGRPGDADVDERYIVQAGSFSRFADADRRKAELALRGVVSRIQKVTVDERTLHRVRIGPVNDIDEVNALRRQLRDAGIDTLVMRVRE